MKQPLIDTNVIQDTFVFPLRNTTFEGVPALIPFRYKEMLTSEYGKKALTNTKFHGQVRQIELGALANHILGINSIKRNLNGSKMRSCNVRRFKN